ncbi:hypothetical protein [Paenibacillus sp. UMB4589-SE434]|uniref:hypothetical protein n=1 Tax=Paenibacillus sp. UMB4589-SE434 TaxID=3046314 RepID=UPI00254A6003|nr:hypothetical protein [Paenibacillus sp. UMB4589-SE434]MDK8183577.1 hypothetical protein [Paenibacillus sp. UMB4589-SE434]
MVYITGIISNHEKRTIWEGQSYTQQFIGYQDETQSWIVYEKDAFTSAIKNKEMLFHPVVKQVDKHGTIRYVGMIDNKLFLEKTEFSTGQQQLVCYV